MSPPQSFELFLAALLPLQPDLVMFKISCFLIWWVKSSSRLHLFYAQHTS